MTWRSWALWIVVAAIVLPHFFPLDRLERMVGTIGLIVMWWYIRWETK